MTHVLETIRRELLEKADERTRLGSQRFFKEAVQTHGVKSAEVARIAKKALKALKAEPKQRIFDLCEELWKSGYLEEGGVACLMAHAQAKRFAPEDMEIFDHWLDAYVSNWASCDTLCNHTVGTLVEQFSELISRLLSWTGSPNRWKRRAAAVSLIIPARKGLFPDAVLEIADALLHDQDDMVQKGYGWMLKAASEAHTDAVFDYLMARKTLMPRTAFRYALEKLPQEMRNQAMARQSKGTGFL